LPRKTFTAGQPLTATELNTYLMTQAVQTYADAAARTTALPTPTEGQIIYLNDINQFQGSHGGSVWYPVAGVMPFIHYNHTAAQSITSGTETTVSSWAQVSFKGMNAASDFFTVSGGTITLVRSGFYRISANANFSTNGTGQRSNQILLSGTSYGRTVVPAYTSSGQTMVQNILEIDAVAGDTVTLQVNQTSGAGLTLTTNTRIKISYIGA
jgi:hypothetical protein